MIVKLKWYGPYSLKTADGRKEFRPPTVAGVYLWCVGHPDFRICYVGKSGNLKDRLYGHITATLGGAYWLFKDTHLIERLGPIFPSTNWDEFKEYEGGFENLLDRFIGHFDVYSARALHNIQSYSFFWSEFSGEMLDIGDRWNPNEVLEAVESALITKARACGQPLQNRRLSRSSAKCPKVIIESTFQQGIEVPGFLEIIEYGDLGH
jgi:hypothetical protein